MNLLWSSCWENWGTFLLEYMNKTLWVCWDIWRFSLRHLFLRITATTCANCTLVSCLPCRPISSNALSRSGGCHSEDSIVNLYVSFSVLEHGGHHTPTIKWQLPMMPQSTPLKDTLTTPYQVSHIGASLDLVFVKVMVVNFCALRVNFEPAQHYF